MSSRKGVGSLHSLSHTKLLVQSLSGRASSILYRRDDQVRSETATSPSSRHRHPPAFYKQAQPFVLATKIRKELDICKPNEAWMAGSCTSSKAEANCVLGHSKQMTRTEWRERLVEWMRGWAFVKEIRRPASSCALIHWLFDYWSTTKKHKALTAPISDDFVRNGWHTARKCTLEQVL